MNKYIDLDMVCEQTRNASGRLCVADPALLAQFKATATRSKMLQERGPAGVPVVRVVGTGRSIQRFLRQHYCDAKDLPFFVSRIQTWQR